MSFYLCPHLPVTVLLTLVAGLAFGGDDTTPPQLKSLRFTPATIDTSTGAAEVTLSFSVTDDDSGATYFEAAFLDPSGTFRQSATAKFAPTRSATNSVTVNFPRFSNSGSWTLSHVFLSDAVGNTLILNEDSLSSYGFPTRLEVTSVKDTVSPSLTALSFSAAEIDTSSGPVDVKVNYTATDDLSGVNYIELSFVSPSGVTRRGGSGKLEAARSVSNTMNVTFPRFSEAGHWTLGLVFLADAAGNTVLLKPEDLASLGFPTSLEVRSAKDTISPKLTSLRFSPEVIDTGQGPATVKVDFTATDDLSGVKSIEVGFDSPSGSVKQSGSAVFPPVTELKNSVNVKFPAFSEPGRWPLTTVLLADAAGNTMLLDADGIAQLGLPVLQVRSASDTLPPTLDSIRLTQEAIDTTGGPAIVKVEIAATDNSSGIKYAEVGFRSPSGSITQKGSSTFTPAKQVHGWVEVTFPQSSEPGLWKAIYVMIADAAGNSLLLNEDSLSSRSVRVR